MAYKYPLIMDLTGNLHNFQLVQEYEINEKFGVYYNKNKVNKYVLARYNYLLRTFIENIHTETEISYKKMANLIGVRADWLSGWLIWRSDAGFDKLAKLEYFVLNSIYNTQENYPCWCNDSVLQITDSITFEESYNQSNFKKLRGLNYAK